MVQIKNNYKDTYCNQAEMVQTKNNYKDTYCNQAEMIQTRNNYKDIYCKSRRDDINQEQLQGHIL